MFLKSPQIHRKYLSHSLLFNKVTCLRPATLLNKEIVTSKIWILQNFEKFQAFCCQIQRGDRNASHAFLSKRKKLKCIAVLLFWGFLFKKFKLWVKFNESNLFMCMVNQFQASWRHFVNVPMLMTLFFSKCIVTP